MSWKSPGICFGRGKPMHCRWELQKPRILLHILCIMYLFYHLPGFLTLHLWYYLSFWHIHRLISRSKIRLMLFQQYYNYHYMGKLCPWKLICCPGKVLGKIVVDAVGTLVDHQWILMKARVFTYGSVNAESLIEVIIYSQAIREHYVFLIHHRDNANLQ